MPRSQKLWTSVRRSTTTDAVVSLSPVKALITPRFSATKIVPSGAKRTAVGSISPLKAVTSTKPAGTAAAAGAARDTTAASEQTTTATRSAARARPEDLDDAAPAMVA